MRHVFMKAVSFYRRWISPALPGSCRFHPTCSAYAHRALEVYGAGKGLLLTAERLVKCHPFHPGGYDPVPDPRDRAAHEAARSSEKREA